MVRLQSKKLLKLRQNININTKNRSASTTKRRSGWKRSAYIRFNGYSRESACLYSTNLDYLVEIDEELLQGGLEDLHIEQPLDVQKSRAISPAEAFTEYYHSASTGEAISGLFCLVNYDCCADEAFGIQHTKTVTEFFGGDKPQAKQIPLWYYLCPKHFRELTQDGPTFQYVRLELVSRQLDLVERLFPGTHYTIRLLDCDLSRIQDEDHRALLYDVNGRDKHGYPLSLSFLRNIQTCYCGTGKSATWALELVDALRSTLNGGWLSEVPVVEFLASVPRPYRQIRTRSG